MTNTDQERWSRVKGRLKVEVGDDVYSSWFARMDLEGKEEGIVRLSVPTRFLKSWIQSHYAERVLACWQAEEPAINRIELIVRSAVLRSAVVKPKAELEQGAGDGSRFGASNGRPMFVGDPGVHEALGGSPLDPRLSLTASWSAAPIRWRMPPPNKSPPPSAVMR
jgi:chromosomal replication initiator protein